MEIPFTPAEQAKILTIGDIEYMVDTIGKFYGECTQESYLSSLFNGLHEANSKR